MRKLLAIAISLLAVLIIVPASASAQSKTRTEVSGVISNGSPVKDAKVTVVCNGHTQSDTTNRSGAYDVTFPGNQCPDGSTVRVMAKKGSMSGTSSAVANGTNCHMNVAVINVSVPELGTVAGVSIAAVGAGDAFFLVRRRQLGQV